MCNETMIRELLAVKGVTLQEAMGMLQETGDFAKHECVSNEPEKEPACVRGDRIVFEVEAAGLLQAVEILKAGGMLLLTLAGTDERERDGSFKVYFEFYHFASRMQIGIQMSLNGVTPEYPSITPIFPPAHWLERELKDMLGITAIGHPDLRRLAVHPDWPEDIYPLRKDFVPGTIVPRVQGEIDLCLVEGDGLYEIPVGPVHAGIIEPGHFRFFAFGEDIINLQAQLFYTHRGVEKAAEGKTVEDAILVAERVCGVCSTSHAAAFAQAVENIAGVDIPKRAKYIRTILLELERLYNHVGDIGNICAGVGFAYAISRGAILKERLMRLNLRLTGHRYLRGTLVPGGVKIDFSDLSAFDELEGIEKDLRQLTKVILSSQSVLDRMQTTGVLAREWAVDLGAVGPSARAAGVQRDVRADLPYAAYPYLDFEVPVQQEGDVFCRFIQRCEECWQSFALVRQAVAQLPQGELAVKLPDLAAYATGVGCTESARGADAHWVMIGPDNTVFSYRVRSASHCNWPVLPLCLPGNIVPDFPLVNKSFELCYACLDR